MKQERGQFLAAWWMLAGWLAIISTLPGAAQEARKPVEEVAAHLGQLAKSGYFATLEAKVPEYLPLLEKEGKGQTNDLSIQTALGLGYWVSKEYAKAGECFAKAYRLSNKEKNIGFLHAASLWVNKEPLKAREIFKELRDLNPTDPVRAWDLLFYDAGIQKYEEAMAALDIELTTFPQRAPPEALPFLVGQYGLCQLYLGEHARGIAILERADTLRPYTPVLMTALAEAYLKNGESEKANAFFDKVLALDPKFLRALYYKGEYLEKKGDKEKAAGHFRVGLYAGKDLVEGPGGGEGSDNFLMALCCEKLGLNDEAKAYRVAAQERLYTYEAPYRTKE